MVLKIPQESILMSFTRLIEDNAHLYLPIKPIPYTSYIPEQQIINLFRCSHEALYNQAATSKDIHAIELPTGALLFHPDGLLSFYSKQHKLTLKKLKKEIKAYLLSLGEGTEYIH